MVTMVLITHTMITIVLIILLILGLFVGGPASASYASALIDRDTVLPNKRQTIGIILGGPLGWVIFLVLFAISLVILSIDWFSQ